MQEGTVEEVESVSVTTQDEEGDGGSDIMPLFERMGNISDFRKLICGHQHQSTQGQMVKDNNVIGLLSPEDEVELENMNVQEEFDKVREQPSRCVHKELCYSQTRKQWKGT